MQLIQLLIACSITLLLFACSADYTEECDTFCSKIETCGLPIQVTNCKTDCNEDISDDADLVCQTSFEALATCFDKNTCEDILDEDAGSCTVETTAWLANCAEYMD